MPRFKLMLFYDLATGDIEEYYQFVMTEMVPAIQDMGLYIFGVYHTLWGDYPHRQAEFVAEDLATIHHVLDSEAWHELESRLQQYTTSYSRKIVRFRSGFQL
jgi:hypothetical protein